MTRRSFSNSLLRGIFDVAREIRMLTNPHWPSPTPAIRTVSPLHLPDVWVPSQYLINMGLRPARARHLSSVYMDIVALYRQVIEAHFRCAIRGSCHPEHYRDMFVVHFRDTIQVLASRMMSTAWVWLCRAGLHPSFSRAQHIDVRISVVATFMKLIYLLFRYVWMPLRKLRSFRDLVSRQHRSSWIQLVSIPSLFSKPPDFQLPHLYQTSNIIELPVEESKAEGDFPTEMVRGSLVLWTLISFLRSCLHLCLPR
jgi:hypothetical protein